MIIRMSWEVWRFSLTEVSASQHLFRKREQATFLAQHHEMQQKHQLIRAMQAVA